MPLGELTGTNLGQGAVQVVGVETTFLDEHVTRCPIAGRAKQLRHNKGKLLSLRREEAPFVNERHTRVIENPLLDVAVAQVASRLVRRVESFLTLDETVHAGLRLGVITLWPLMAVLLPLRAGPTLEVKPGDRVTCRRLRAGTPGRRWGRASS